MTVIINGTDNAVGNPAIQGGTGGTSAGLYYPAANTVAITTSGVNALTISSTQNATFANNVTITGTSTHTGNAAFSNISTTGSVGIGTATPNDPLQVQGTVNSGAVRARVQNSSTTSSSADLILNAGNNNSYIQLVSTYNSAGALVFASSLTSGQITVAGAYPLVFNTNSTERMRIDTNGSVFIGSTGINARLGVQGTTTDSTSQTIYLQNSAGTQLMYIRNDGYFTTGQATYSPYNYTTGNAANLYIDANGGLVRSTSSLKYKHDVKDAYYGLANLLQLRPVTYKGNNDGDKVFGGLIAEEVDAAGLKEFVVYREDDGTPDGLAYGNMVSLCIKAIQELKAELDEANTKIAALQAKLGA